LKREDIKSKDPEKKEVKGREYKGTTGVANALLDLRRTKRELPSEKNRGKEIEGGGLAATGTKKRAKKERVYSKIPFAYESWTKQGQRVNLEGENHFYKNYTRKARG